MAVSNEENRFALCVGNVGYPASLMLHKVYRILPDEDAKANRDLRIIAEQSGTPLVEMM
jgi:hypothetical protein